MTDKKYYWISDGDCQHSGYMEGPPDSCLEDAMEAWENDMNPNGYEMIGHPWLNREGCREVSKEEYEEGSNFNMDKWAEELKAATEAWGEHAREHVSIYQEVAVGERPAWWEMSTEPYRLMYEDFTEEEKEAHDAWLADKARLASKLEEMEKYKRFFDRHQVLALGFILLVAIFIGSGWLSICNLIRYIF